MVAFKYLNGYFMDKVLGFSKDADGKLGTIGNITKIQNCI